MCRPTSAARSSASVAVGDPDHDGIPTSTRPTSRARSTAGLPDGSRSSRRSRTPPIRASRSTPFENVRQGETNRTQHGFFGSPVLADLDGDGDRGDDRRLDGPPRLRVGRPTTPIPSAPGGADEVAGLPGARRRPGEGRVGRPRDPRVTFKARRRLRPAGSDHRHAGGRRHRRRRAPGDRHRHQRGVRRADQRGTGDARVARRCSRQRRILSPGNSRALRDQAGRRTRDGDPLPGDALLPGWPFSAGIAARPSCCRSSARASPARP